MANAHFVSVTNGDAGHQTMRGSELAKRRLVETKESARRQGIEYDVPDNHDGELLPTLAVREQISRAIRSWRADVVLAARPNDYHPDHRYTGSWCRMLLIWWLFRTCHQTCRPCARIRRSFIDQEISALDSHVSQFYEWLPWIDGKLEEVPRDPSERRAWPDDARLRQLFPMLR